MNIKHARRATVALSCALTLLWAGSAAAGPLNLRITFENLAPDQGTRLTPLWFGLHDGSFDNFDAGSSAAMTPLERIAEDGNPGPIIADFAAGAPGRFIDGVVFGPGIGAGSPPIFGPGGVGSVDISYDFGMSPTAYFSYASMVIPSNDAFIGNDDPLGIPLFDLAGAFLGADFLVLGSQVRDAGTEVNDEVPEHTAGLAQMTPDTGIDELGGIVGAHAGFNPGGNILAEIPGGDFTQPGYQIARIRIEQIPEPGTWWLFGAGAMTLGIRKLKGSARKSEPVQV